MSFGDKKLSEIAVSVPGSTSLLREYDLDFCCGGSDTLSNAAAEKGLNLAEIETRLTVLQNSKAENPEEYWVGANYGEVIDHILVRYHQRHREQLQELIVLADRVESVHGDRDDCPIGVAAELRNPYDERRARAFPYDQSGKLYDGTNANSYDGNGTRRTWRTFRRIEIINKQYDTSS